MQPLSTVGHSRQFGGTLWIIFNWDLGKRNEDFLLQNQQRIQPREAEIDGNASSCNEPAKPTLIAVERQNIQHCKLQMW